MGGGSGKETLVFIHNTEEPKNITDSIRTQFPYVEVIFYRLTPIPGKKYGRDTPLASEVPESVWQSATILVTLFALPPRPELAPNLKWIQLLSAGIDHLISQPIFTDTKIPITTASGIHGPSIAEWILMTTLNLSKNYNLMHKQQENHKWNSNIGLFQKRDWHGRVVGIAGYGSIGRQVARVFKGLGCRIHAFTASPRSTPESRRDNGFLIPDSGDPEGVLPEAWYSGNTRGDLHTFLASGLDLLVISLPLTPATKHLFGEKEFDILYKSSLDKVKQKSGPQNSASGKLPDGEGCIISNIARGPVIDQPAIIEALKNGKLQGAALDVTDPEPLPEDSELWDLQNVIVTPHLSAHFANYVERVFDIVGENLRRLANGEELVNLVRRDRGY